MSLQLRQSLWRCALVLVEEPAVLCPIGCMGVSEVATVSDLFIFSSLSLSFASFAKPIIRVWCAIDRATYPRIVTVKTRLPAQEVSYTGICTGAHPVGVTLSEPPPSFCSRVVVPERAFATLLGYFVDSSNHAVDASCCCRSIRTQRAR